MPYRGILVVASNICFYKNIFRHFFLFFQCLNLFIQKFLCPNILRILTRDKCHLNLSLTSQFDFCHETLSHKHVLQKRIVYTTLEIRSQYPNYGLFPFHYCITKTWNPNGVVGHGNPKAWFNRIILRPFFPPRFHQPPSSY